MSRPLLFNPGRMSKEELIAGFIVRKAQLEELLALVRHAPAEDAPQHALVIGWRGMGKTTLLHRLAYAVEDEPELAAQWLPVRYDEEQYNVGGLADFWLNTLEMLAEATGRPEWRALVDELTDSHADAALEEAARGAVLDCARELEHRLILLVDNVDHILGTLDDVEASRLRELLQREPNLLLVGTSSRAIEATYDYDQPFYELFRVIDLAPMSEEETLTLLRGAAMRDGEEVVERIDRHAERLAKLRLLMGGNPRTTALLYEMLRDGTAHDFRGQLERLLDRHTSLYKDRVEALPQQQRRIFDAIAQHWDPLTAPQIAEAVRLERGPVQAQLTRMANTGLLEKVDIGERATGYQLAERFFNIWYLMRGSRRGRRRLQWLVSWIELFYDGHELSEQGEALLGALDGADGERRRYLAETIYALCKVLQDGEVADGLVVSTLRPELMQYLTEVERGEMAARLEGMFGANLADDLTGAAAKLFLEGVGTPFIDQAPRWRRFIRAQQLGDPDYEAWRIPDLILAGLFGDEERVRQRLRELLSGSSPEEQAYFLGWAVRALLAGARPDAAYRIASLYSRHDETEPRLIELAKPAVADAAVAMTLALIGWGVPAHAQIDSLEAEAILAAVDFELLSMRAPRTLPQLVLGARAQRGTNTSLDANLIRWLSIPGGRRPCVLTEAQLLDVRKWLADQDPSLPVHLGASWVDRCLGRADSAREQLVAALALDPSDELVVPAVIDLVDLVSPATLAEDLTAAGYAHLEPLLLALRARAGDEDALLKASPELRALATDALARFPTA